ncbi:MAG: CopG family transcriptional regulator [Acidimicrobiales bacterium]
MSKKIDDVLAEEGAASENYELPEEVPEGIKVSRPNLGRPTVVSVRLSAEEHEQIQRAAGDANLPLSTLIRIWVLDRLRSNETGDSSSVTERLARLEKAVFDRSA